jgi:glycosyltransferase involved in cell wall biosynthesis
MVIAVSSVVKAELKGLPRVTLIGHELPFSNPEFSLPTRKVILYPANFTPGKGQEYALRAFARLAAKHGSWTLRFVGGDLGLPKNQKFRRQLQEQAQRELPDGQVEWVDFVKNMESEYCQAALVLNFSESESFSLTCLEGLYFGRPVIATKSGGPQEILDEHSGILVEVGNVDEMATAIDRLLSDADLRVRMGKHAYKMIRQRFDTHRATALLAKVYHQAVTGI